MCIHRLWSGDINKVGQKQLEGRRKCETPPRKCKVAQPCNCVWQICDIFWLNCEFYDTSMTFDTQLEIVISKIFGYRAIADLPRDKRGSHL